MMSAMLSTAPLRRLKLSLGLAMIVLMAGLGAAAEASGQPLAGEDSVTGSATFIQDPCSSKFDCGAVIGVDAHSGPSGESPYGSFGLGIITSEGPGPSFTGRVTCLNVEANRATVGVDGPAPVGAQLVTVEDNGGAGNDRIAMQRVSTTPLQCPAPQPGTGSLIANGHFAVHDALPIPPVPTVKAQCKKGGWKQYGFKNQGRCVAYVLCTHRPFRARASGTFPPHQPGIVEGIYLGTHIGKGTYRSDNASVTTSGDTLSYSGDLVVTAANGDKLFMSGTGSGSLATLILTLTDTIAGGTGRFEGAGGTLVSEVRAVPTPDGGYSTTSRIKGTISLTGAGGGKCGHGKGHGRPRH